MLNDIVKLETQFYCFNKPKTTRGIMKILLTQLQEQNRMDESICAKFKLSVPTFNMGFMCVYISVDLSFCQFERLVNH